MSNTAEELARADPQAVPGLGLSLAVLTVSSLTVMANATISPSLPGMVRTFSHVPGIETLAGLVLSLPSLTIMLTAGLFGRALERTNRRTLTIVLLFVYALGGASGALANSIWGLLAGRVLLGIAVGGTMTLATTIVGDRWHGAAQQRFMGLQAAAMAAGGVIFVTVGGWLADVSWRGPFLIYLSALVLVPLCLAFVPPYPAAPRPSAEGAVTERFPWRVFAGIALLTFFAMTMFYLIPTRLPFLLVEIGVHSPSAAGYAIAAMTVGSVTTSLAFVRIRRRLGPRTIFAIAFILMGCGYAMVGIAESYVPVVYGTTVAGLGLGLTFPNQMSWLMAQMPDGMRGRSAGFLTSAIFGGHFVSPLLSGAFKPIMSTSEIFLLFAAALVVCAALTATPRNLSR